LPLLRTKKEVFEWLKEGRKTIDIRKGKPHNGETAVFETGRHVLRLKIVKKECGPLMVLVRSDNFKQVIPSANTLEDAVNYLRRLYGDSEDVFTAYYVRAQVC
jgi:ASC-1-like (ASCH) protein